LVVENLNILDYEYFFKTVDLILEGKMHDLFLLYRNILQAGFDGLDYVAGLADHLRDLMVARDASTLELLEVGENIRRQYHEQAQRTSMKFLVNALKLVGDTDARYKPAHNKRLLVESCLMQLAAPFLVESDEKKKVLA
jgi:DNA polymerase-3 subunit gamma/tau